MDYPNIHRLRLNENAVIQSLYSLVSEPIFSNYMRDVISRKKKIEDQFDFADKIYQLSSEIRVTGWNSKMKRRKFIKQNINEKLKKKKRHFSCHSDGYKKHKKRNIAKYSQSFAMITFIFLSLISKFSKEGSEYIKLRVNWVMSLLSNNSLKSSKMPVWLVRLWLKICNIF